MVLHNGLDIEVYDLRPTDLQYYQAYVTTVTPMCAFFSAYVL